MMEQNPARPARKVAIADHIWQAFEEMAQSMGTDRDGLINQAMFMFARLNGFLDGGQQSASAPASRGAGAVALNGARPAPSKPSAPPVLAPVASSPPSRGGSSKLDDDPVRREVAERVLETAAELERLIKGKSAPEDSSDANLSADDLDGGGDDAGMDDGGEEHGGEAVEGEGEGEGGQLYLMAEGGELDRIVKEKFLIGRGKHCDFVINSGKVSREHAAIVRDQDGFYIEDLGSSNGTWFNKQRIKRRKIEDGDEYFICSERIKLVVR